MEKSRVRALLREGSSSWLSGTIQTFRPFRSSSEDHLGSGHDRMIKYAYLCRLFSALTYPKDSGEFLATDALGELF